MAGADPRHLFWLDEDQEPGLKKIEAKEREHREQQAVLAAMDKAARAGLGSRGRIRAGERALRAERTRMTREEQG